MDNEDITINCNHDDGEGGEEDTSCLSCSHQLAQDFLTSDIMFVKEHNNGIYLILPPCPVLVQEVHQGEGHGESTEEQVRYGQVCYEDVARCQHNL